ncbi:cobalt/nickel ECF transporter CbiMNQO, S component CbiN [Arcobacter venerupis]|uniref:Cobalt/nickel ECF transporter CbiMNQO, S component CbiN n=1 Tax=Arcobacter venerupis TaxID=1054033 RepID=A0AAE7E339_9BACT|nr:hypothetical protein [Arcobacter venerupis]QKF66848.1 cobalt/nickel ECF transporter CbiMNQO, S component CbiN [Arcobacter venerupis]RWS49843.1 hypothetical protein CKA56_07075 [Arcobacter venerupis]
MKSFLIFIILATSLFAHKLNLFVTNEQNGVEIYSYFADGTPCMNCRLLIKNNENLILEDKLNEKGKYLFSSKYKEIEITIDATSGHIAKQDVIVENIKNESLQTHIKEQKSDEHIKILISLVLIALIFYAIKIVKRKKEQ